MKPKILFILHLPPPIHGAAMMGKYIQESELVNSSFDCFCINLATAGSLSDIGHISLKKAVEVFLSSKAYFSRCKRNPSRIGLYHSECRRKSLF